MTNKAPPFKAEDIRAAMELAKIVRAAMVANGLLSADKDYKPSEILAALRASCSE